LWEEDLYISKTENKNYFKQAYLTLFLTLIFLLSELNMDPTIYK